MNSAPALNSWSVLWMLVFMGVALIEGIALGTGHSEYTLSYSVRALRFDPVGRFVFLPLWWWLTVHFVLAPKWIGVRPEWRGYLGLSLGVVHAVAETVGWLR